MFRHRSFSLGFRQTDTSRLCSAFSSSSEQNVQNRVPRALYRQLLAWCRKYDDVTFHPLPPVTISRPQVNLVALKRLQEMRSFLDTLSPQQVSTKMKDFLPGEGARSESTGHPHPAHHALYADAVETKENMITFPEIRNTNELRAIIRSVFWLNNRSALSNMQGQGVNAPGGTADDEVKEQISLAFEAMKSCNELSSLLDRRRHKREANIRVRQAESARSDSDEVPDVKYHVGQVVKHNNRAWRGIVVGWDIVEKHDDAGRRSSLTTKQYTIPHLESKTQSCDSSATGKKRSLKDDVTSIKYTVIVDVYDAQSDNNLMAATGSMEIAPQGDLSPVEDPCLQRVHSKLIKQHFTRFDSKGRFFVPNNILKYVYPMDAPSTCEDAADAKSSVNIQTDTSIEKSCLAITEGVRKVGSRLLDCLSEAPCRQQLELDAEASLMMSSLKSSVQSMLEKNAASQKLEPAISSLAKLDATTVKINTLLARRTTSQKNKHRINFTLGQIVKHKLYGFRGIVSAWDSKPGMDVSNWDGLKDVKNPNEKPFYHIHPDKNDCIAAFGGPRDFRYVCQDNLELSLDQKPLELNTDLDHQEWKWNGENGRYVPSPEIKFMFAEDLGEHEKSLIATVQHLRKILSDSLLEIRDADESSLFSMDDLFCQLQFGVSNFEDAVIVQDLIKTSWKETPDCDLRRELDDSIADLLAGNYETALATLSNIVASDPSYGEAWNKKATVHYMMGDACSALEAAREALKIEPRNFQVLAGIGLIEMDSSDYDKAESTFRKCLSINPWLAAVSSKLSTFINSKSK